MHVYGGADSYPLLRSKLPVGHQVNLISEVHAHGQLDEEVDAEAVTTLRNRRLTCNTHKVRSVNTSYTGTFLCVCERERNLGWFRWVQCR